MNLVCEIRFAQARHAEHLREAEQHRLLCSSTPKEENLLKRLQLHMINRANIVNHKRHTHNQKGQ